jgi:hypothetical protein
VGGSGQEATIFYVFLGKNPANPPGHPLPKVATSPLTVATGWTPRTPFLLTPRLLRHRLPGCHFSLAAPFLLGGTLTPPIARLPFRLGGTLTPHIVRLPLLFGGNLTVRWWAASAPFNKQLQACSLRRGPSQHSRLGRFPAERNACNPLSINQCVLFRIPTGEAVDQVRNSAVLG